MSDEGTIKERLAGRKGLIEKDVPGFGKVWFRRLSVNRMLELSDMPGGEFAKAVTAESLCEADGAAVFTIEQLGGETFAEIKPLRELAMEVNALSPEKKTEAVPTAGQPSPT